MREFFRQLQKRQVIKVAIAYLIVAWLALQLADVIFPAMQLPEWSTSLVLGLLIVGFPLALVLSWVFDITPDGILRAEQDAQTDDAVASESAVLPEGPSIAVLPFRDMSAEKDQGHFCDGLTEELLNVLTRIPKLRVASRTSSFSFKGKKTDLKTAAKKLQVAHILEGSVRKSGNKIRVTAQLIEAATDSHLWSETYDRDLDDIFAIQDDLAAKILDALQCRLGTETLPDPTTDNPKAYEYFLRGRGYAISGSDRDIALSLEMFQKAVDADPAFISLAKMKSGVSSRTRRQLRQCSSRPTSPVPTRLVHTHTVPASDSPSPNVICTKHLSLTRLLAGLITTSRVRNFTRGKSSKQSTASKRRWSLTRTTTRVRCSLRQCILLLAMAMAVDVRPESGSNVPSEFWWITPTINALITSDHPACLFSANMIARRSGPNEPCN
jgi:TolB-like protein